MKLLLLTLGCVSQSFSLSFGRILDDNIKLNSDRRRFTQGIVGSLAVFISESSNAVVLDQPTAIVEPFLSNNPFSRLETVAMVPKEYFEDHRSIYCFTERVIDGDTIRVRHVPGYSFITDQVPQPLQKRSIVDETLLIRLYGVDAPETAKKKDQVSQPFAMDAKKFTSDLVYHQMVKVTFLRRDPYGRAVAVVETVPGSLFSGSQDVSLELAKVGLAELYVGGGAEYNSNRLELKGAIEDARRQHRGVWSLGDEYVSVADFKRQLRSKQSDVAFQ